MSKVWSCLIFIKLYIRPEFYEKSLLKIVFGLQKVSKKYHLFIATVRVFIFIDEIIINCEHANYYLDALALMQPLNSLNSIQ